MNQLAAIGALQMQMAVAGMVDILIIIAVIPFLLKATDLPLLGQAGEQAVDRAFTGCLITVSMLQGEGEFLCSIALMGLLLQKFQDQLPLLSLIMTHCFLQFESDSHIGQYIIFKIGCQAKAINVHNFE